MCARFSVASAESVGLYFQGRLAFDEGPRYNIAPSEPVFAGLLAPEGLVGRDASWGLELGPRKVINLRSEGPMIGKTWGAFRRVVVPATSFFEWREENGVRIPYLFGLASGDAFGIAGIGREIVPGTWQVALLTTSPNSLVAEYHDRMPSLLSPEDVDEWLGAPTPHEACPLALTPYPAERMRVYPVSRKVGNPRFKDQEAIQRVSPQPGLFD